MTSSSIRIIQFNSLDSSVQAVSLYRISCMSVKDVRRIFFFFGFIAIFFVFLIIDITNPFRFIPNQNKIDRMYWPCRFHLCIQMNFVPLYFFFFWYSSLSLYLFQRLFLTFMLLHPPFSVPNAPTILLHYLLFRFNSFNSFIILLFIGWCL